MGGRKAVFDAIQSESPAFPHYFSAQSKDFISKLLVKEPEARLGMGPGGFDDIKCDPRFHDIDFDELMQRSVAPPWSPQIEGVLDFRYMPKSLLNKKSVS